jgi:hypothetical protein
MIEDGVFVGIVDSPSAHQRGGQGGFAGHAATRKDDGPAIDYCAPAVHKHPACSAFGDPQFEIGKHRFRSLENIRSVRQHFTFDEDFPTGRF